MRDTQSNSNLFERPITVKRGSYANDVERQTRRCPCLPLDRTEHHSPQYLETFAGRYATLT